MNEHELRMKQDEYRFLAEKIMEVRNETMLLNERFMRLEKHIIGTSPPSKGIQGTSFPFQQTTQVK
jgi:hypothetical protein